MLTYMGKGTKEEYQVLSEAFDTWVQDYLAVMDSPPDSGSVQALMPEHFRLIVKFLENLWKGEREVNLDYELYLFMADAKLNDEVSFEMYEHYAKGMAEHLQLAMLEYAKTLA